MTREQREAVAAAMLDIIRHYETVKLARAEERLAAAQRTVDRVQEQIAACRVMLEAAREQDDA